jgi:hypothetical protein
LAWRRSIEVLEDGAARPRTLSLFPEDRCEGLLADASIVGVKLSELRLRRPRQWGACWLALLLWRELQLDQFWSKRLGVSRKGTRWDQVLFVLVAYRLLAPGSEWRLHREWFRRSALADLLGEDAGLAEIHKLYRCHDRLLVHKQAVFDHLTGRWRDLFNISYDVLLYDLTSTYFEADPPFPEGDKRRFGYSRDHRPDCVQILIALVVTPEGLPLAYEVLPGNTADKTTLRVFLIAFPAGTPALRMLADKTPEVLAGMSHALNGLALLVADPARPVSRHSGVFRLRVPDWLLAAVNAGRTFVTIGAVALFWIVSAWPSGAVAITWAAISVILFAPQADQAYATAMSFTVGTGIAAVAAAIIAFAALPGLETFAAFCLVIGVWLVPTGAAAAQPWQRTALPICRYISCHCSRLRTR